MTVSVVQDVVLGTWSGSLGAAATAGNTLIYVVTAYTSSGAAISTSAPAYNGGSVSGATLLKEQQGPGTNAVYTATWMLPDIAAGGTAVGITVTGADTPGDNHTVGLTVYEVSGLGSSPSLDQSSSSSGTSTAVTSGTSGAVTTAPEFVLGSLVIFGQVMSPVGSPWTEPAQLSDDYCLSGYQLPATSGASYTYAQTAGGSASWAGTIVTVAPGSTARTASAALTVTPSGAASGGHARSGTAALTVTPSAAASGGHPRTATAALAVTPSAAVTAPQPFPRAPLGIRCELDLGGTWTDVTGYVYQRAGTSAPVQVARGRPDEAATANPGKCSWQWNNRDGRFSPLNPLSPYYGQLQRNTPVRWSVPAASSYLRLENDSDDRAAIVDAPAVDVTGSIEMRLALRLTDWRACVLAAKWDGGGCWVWLLNGDGTLTFGWYESGGAYRQVTSSAPVPYAGGDFGLRVTMDAASGDVTFYTGAGATVDGTWAQLGDVQPGTGGAASGIATASSPVVVGWSDNFAGQLCGRAYEYRLYDGLAAGGTVACDADFTGQAPGVTSFTDAQGNDWLVQGGADITDRDFRFNGEMSSQPPKWDVTGKDQWVAAQAGGTLRRLQQGTANAMSAMKRAILLQSGSLAPVAYWPMEDSTAATQFGAAAGPYPMTFTDAPPPKLASDSTFLSSAPLPALNGSRLNGRVAPYAATGSWAVRFLLRLPAAPSKGGTLMRVVTQPSAAVPVLYLNVDTGGNFEFIGYAQDGSEAFNTGYYDYGALSYPLWVSIEATPVTGGVRYNLVALAPGSSAGSQLPQVVTTTLGAGNVTAVQPDAAGTFAGAVMGHLSVQSAWSSLFDLGQPLAAWSGELAADRFARLAGENGYKARILGSPAASAAMGPQALNTLAALLQECETADMGQILEPRQQLALGYRTLASMCSQSPVLTLDYASAEPGGVGGTVADSGLDPTYDDQLSKNDWTVTRASAGSTLWGTQTTVNQGGTWQHRLNDGSAMSVSPPPAGIGDYGSQKTVNVESDAQLPDAAGWLVGLGTVPEARWPLIPVNLARPEMTGLREAAAAVDVGDMIAVTTVPDTVVYDTVQQLALGFAENLGGFWWDMEFSCVPEDPYDVMVLDDPVTGRADTDGSALASAATATATTLSVATTAGYALWTTDPADCPFDVAVGGERMTVTAVSGTSSPQSFTVTRSVNEVVKAQPSGAGVRLWTPPVLSLA